MNNQLDAIRRALKSGHFMQACSLFCSIQDDDLFTEAARQFPGLMNYDARGNWVGAVPNENGWTP